MMKFCPMCGEKIPSETSKFCMGCGLNLVDYRKKLEHLSASEPLDKNNSSRETKTASGKSAPPRPRVDEPQDMTRSLFERFGYLPHLYFNVSGEKNSMKVNSAVKAYAHDAANENIIFVLDDTLFGGGEDGFWSRPKTFTSTTCTRKPSSFRGTKSKLLLQQLTNLIKESR